MHWGLSVIATSLYFVDYPLDYTAVDMGCFVEILPHRRTSSFECCPLLSDFVSNCIFFCFLWLEVYYRPKIYLLLGEHISIILFSWPFGVAIIEHPIFYYYFLVFLYVMPISNMMNPLLFIYLVSNLSCLWLLRHCCRVRRRVLNSLMSTAWN